MVVYLSVPAAYMYMYLYLIVDLRGLYLHVQGYGISQLAREAYCDHPNIVLTPALSSGWWMACKKVAMVVSSISKHCVCLNPLLPSEGLCAGGTLPFVGEEREGLN